MAKYTLLEVVNSYLDATDGIRVSDLDDTPDSQSVAKIAEDVFYEVVNDVFNTPLTKDIIELEALADSSKPNYLKIPDELSSISESTIYYNTTDGESGSSTVNWNKIQYLHPHDFLERIRHRSTEADNVQTVEDFSGVDLIIVNNKAPQYCTSFDDEYLVFDSFDSDVDSTLQQSKSAVLGSVEPTFTVSNSFVIPLPQWFHPTYVQLVKSRASEYLRQEPLVSDTRKGIAGLIKARSKMRVGNRKFQKKRYGRR